MSRIHFAALPLAMLVMLCSCAGPETGGTWGLGGPVLKACRPISRHERPVHGYAPLSVASYEAVGPSLLSAGPENPGGDPARAAEPTASAKEPPARTKEPPNVPRPTEEPVESAPAPDVVGEADGTGHGMTLADLEQMALEANPTLALAGAEIEKERGLWVQTGLYPNPTVGYVQSNATEEGESQTSGLLIQQTFITAGKLEKNRAIESFGIQNVSWQMEAQQLRVLTDVRLRYFDVLGTQQQVELITELRDLAEETLKTTRDLFKAKEVARTDVIQAEAQLAQFELAVENARAERFAAWGRLAVIVGRPDLPLCHLAEPLQVLPEFHLEEEWARLLANSPQLRSTEAQVGIAHRQLIREQADPVPDITVQIVGDYDWVNDFATINSLVALPVPLFDRNQGQIYNSFHEYHRAKREVDRVQLVLRDQLVVTYRDYVQARNEAVKLREDVLPKLRETLELKIKAYRQGEFGYSEVLAAQEAFFRTSVDQLTALTRARQIGAQIVGLQLTGGLNPASIGTAIQEGGGQRRAVQALLNQQNAGQLNTFAPAAID